MVKWVSQWQQETYQSLIKVLDPSFLELVPSKDTSKLLVERICLDSGLRLLRTQISELDALYDWAGSLRKQLKESVEILEEDHGKAILVFTMITTIFLPL